MKHIKFYEQFILLNEKDLYKKSNFYHITLKKNLQSFKNGADWKIADNHSSNDSKSQGGGIYLFDTEENLDAWIENKKLDDMMLEFNIELNPEYFEVDSELMNFNSVTKRTKSSWGVYWQNLLDTINELNFNVYYIQNVFDDNIKLEKINKQDIYNKWKYSMYELKEQPVFILSKDELSENDIEIIDNNMTYIDVKSSKNIGFFNFYSFGGGDQEQINKSMESLKKIGIYQKFNEKILQISHAFRYKGPVIYFSRYKIRNEDGSWGKWQNK